MKFNFLKHSVSVVIVTSLLLSLCACDRKEQRTERVEIEPMEIEEVHSLSFDFLGGKDVMPIGGFYGPYSSTYSYNGVNLPDYISDEIFSLIADCGLNMINQTNTEYDSDPKGVIELLKLGEKYNIGIIVKDGMVSGLHREDALSLEELDKRIQSYSSYPAFCGMYVQDEAGTSYYHPELENSNGFLPDFVPIFEKLDALGISSYFNLIGGYAVNERETIERYYEEAASTLDLKYMSSTNYTWDNEGSKSNYLYNMDTIRYIAEKNGLPFWAYHAAGGQWNDDGRYFDSEEYYPTEGEFYWSVNTSLAYGAKGIKYFMIIQPHYFAYAESTDFDAQRNGLIGIWGNKTQWYYYAQNVNKQIDAVDSVLMNSVSKGVIASGEEAEKDFAGLRGIMEGKSWRELENVQGNAMIGCFNYQGKSALYVVNYETEYAQKITLDLVDAFNVTLIQNAEVSRVNVDSLTLDMGAGEGVLVVFD